MKAEIREALQEISTIAREYVLRSIHTAGSGHPAGSLGMIDIMTYLYFKEANIDPDTPKDPKRDRIILSNGHICPALYTVLALRGYFDTHHLRTLRSFGSSLQGHPHRESLPGLETSSGPLGSGISQACGMALGAPNCTVYCMTSDGEHEEGNTWEAVLFAAKYKLSNLIVIIDRNHIEIDGTTEQVMPLKSLTEKYDAFHWDTHTVDGHDYDALQQTMRKAKQSRHPSVIVAETTPGKGVSFMENDAAWHGRAPSDAELIAALEELT